MPVMGGKGARRAEVAASASAPSSGRGAVGLPVRGGARSGACLWEGGIGPVRKLLMHQLLPSTGSGAEEAAVSLRPGTGSGGNACSAVHSASLLCPDLLRPDPAWP